MTKYYSIIHSDVQNLKIAKQIKNIQIINNS